MKKNLLLLLWFLSLASATRAEIDPGMWGIEAELNGQPGRGLQIDHQNGDFLIITYFGYRSDGSSLFLQSSGKRKGDIFEGELVEYRGGTPIAAPYSPGSALASMGRIRLEFTSPVTGKMTLPGESEKNIRRLTFENNLYRFTAFYFSGVSISGYAVPQDEKFQFSLDNGQFLLVQSNLATGAFLCEYKGEYFPTGKGIISSGTATCGLGSNSERFPYKTGILTVSDNGIYSGEIFLLSEDGKEWYLAANHMGVCTAAALNLPTRCRPDLMEKN